MNNEIYNPENHSCEGPCLKIILNEKTGECEKNCEEGEIFETNKCKSICPKGESYNIERKNVKKYVKKVKYI